MNCSRCINNVPNYHHVHRVDSLPKAVRTDSRIVARSYAVELSGSIPQLWVFFDDLEPALIFGRSGRMSSYDIRGYGVFPAARECRYDEELMGDLVTLYIDQSDGSLDRRDNEADVFQRWMRGCRRDSSHFHPPPSKPTKRPQRHRS